jgi:hypothetical protein
MSSPFAQLPVSAIHGIWQEIGSLEIALGNEYVGIVCGRGHRIFGYNGVAEPAAVKSLTATQMEQTRW